MTAATATAPCGTRSAYQRHRRHGEEPDEACRQANTAYHRRLRCSEPRRETQYGPQTDPACGTVIGFERHRRRYEVPCAPCRQALREYQRQRKALRAELAAASST